MAGVVAGSAGVVILVEEVVTCHGAVTEADTADEDGADSSLIEALYGSILPHPATATTRFKRVEKNTRVT